eukprot:2152690-Rhodomonas_salina.1
MLPRQLPKVTKLNLRKNSLRSQLSASLERSVDTGWDSDPALAAAAAPNSCSGIRAVFSLRVAQGRLRLRLTVRLPVSSQAPSA